MIDEEKVLRQEIIEYIKTHDPGSVNADLSAHSTVALIIKKTEIEIRNSRPQSS